MKESVKKEVEKIIKKYRLKCSIEEFQNKVWWAYLSSHQELSEDFIREFQDKVHWYYLSEEQQYLKQIIENEMAKEIIEEKEIAEEQQILAEKTFKEKKLRENNALSYLEVNMEEQSNKSKNTEVTKELLTCPFCGGEGTKSNHSDNIICECLRPSNTWVPTSVWQTRKG